MPNKYFTLSFQTDSKVCEDIELRQRKIAELDQLVGNTSESVALQNRDIQIVPNTVSQARYKQAQEAYSNDGNG